MRSGLLVQRQSSFRGKGGTAPVEMADRNLFRGRCNDSLGGGGLGVLGAAGDRTTSRLGGELRLHAALASEGHFLQQQNIVHTTPSGAGRQREAPEICT